MVKDLAVRFGFELRRRRDAYDDQKRLMSSQSDLLIFDVGANVGQTAARYRQLFPNANIVSFEPTPAVFSELTERFGDDERVRLEQVAISDRVGTANFHTYTAPVFNSLLREHRDQRVFLRGAVTGDSIEVPTTTLDEFSDQLGIARIDILKLDIQGAELFALNGARRLMRSQAINLIFTEVSFGNIYEGQVMFHEVSSLLATFGYRVFRLYDLFEGDHGILGWGDALFLSERCYSALIGSNSTPAAPARSARQRVDALGSRSR